MPLQLAQLDECVGPGWWTWSVWLDGTDDELDRVSDVTYLLHPTFPEPVRVVRDRQWAFRLVSAGWGEFTIRAEVRLRDGTVRELTHALKLHEPAERTRGLESALGARGVDAASPVGGDALRVFLSHSAIDGHLASQVSRELESHGMKVTSSADAMSQSPPSADMTRTVLEQSDAVVVLHSDTPSDAVDSALAMARGLQKHVVQVRVGAPPVESASSGGVLQFADHTHAKTIAKALMPWIPPGSGVPSAPAAKRDTVKRGAAKRDTARRDTAKRDTAKRGAAKRAAVKPRVKTAARKASRS